MYPGNVVASIPRKVRYTWISNLRGKAWWRQTRRDSHDSQEGNKSQIIRRQRVRLGSGNIRAGRRNYMDWQCIYTTHYEPTDTRNLRRRCQDSSGGHLRAHSTTHTCHRLWRLECKGWQPASQNWRYPNRKEKQRYNYRNQGKLGNQRMRRKKMVYT